MISENKVKIMTHIATFEEKEKKGAMRIAQYDKKDYTGFYVIVTWLGASVGFFLLLGMLLVSLVNSQMLQISMKQLCIIFLAIVFGYILFSVVYIKISYHIYCKKYMHAKEEMKSYSLYLKRLNRLYDREELEQARVGKGENK